MSVSLRSVIWRLIVIIICLLTGNCSPSPKASLVWPLILERSELNIPMVWLFCQRRARRYTTNVTLTGAVRVGPLVGLSLSQDKRAVYVEPRASLQPFLGACASR